MNESKPTKNRIMTQWKGKNPGSFNIPVELWKTDMENAFNYVFIRDQEQEKMPKE